VLFKFSLATRQDNDRRCASAKHVYCYFKYGSASFPEEYLTFLPDFVTAEAYMQVHNEDKERGSEVTIFDDIKKAMKKRYNALLKRNEEQIHAIQELKNRLEYGDEDNDGVLTRDELEKVVKDIDPQLLEGYTVDDVRA